MPRAPFVSAVVLVGLTAVIAAAGVLPALPGSVWAQSTGNQAPIVNVPAQFSIQEGGTLVIPFTITEPDNDPVDYFVDYIIGGKAQPSLPAGMQFLIDSATQLRRVIWAPDTNQAGTYQLRFRAIDDTGNTGQQDVTVTVTDRTNVPSVMIRRDSPLSGEGNLIGPGEVIHIVEGDTFAVLIAVGDPEGQPVNVTGSGLPTTPVAGSTADTYHWSWTTSSWPPGSFPSAGEYALAVTATDSDGNSTTFPFTLDVARTWSYRDSFRYVVPSVGIPGHGKTGSAEIQSAVLQGDVVINATVRDLRGEGSVIDVPNLTIEYVLVTPQGKQTISPPLSAPPFTYLWDSRTVADGTYVLTSRILGGDKLEGVSAMTNQVIVDNVPGPVTGAQWLPLNASTDFKEWDPASADAVDWFLYPGAPQRAAAHPYPYQVAPPAAQLPDPSVLIDSRQWYIEPLVNPIAGYRRASNKVFTTLDGHLFTAEFFPYIDVVAENALEYVKRVAHVDGPRDVNGGVSPDSTFVPNPTGRGFWGIDIAGRLFRIDTDGTVTTVAGYKIREDVEPYYRKDTGISQAQVTAHQKQLIGNFVNNVTFNMPIDLAFDPTDADIVYVADAGNHRIAKVDVSTPVPTISTFAGQAGVAGYQDGPKASALFNKPYSLVITDDARTMYIADRENSVIRAIDMASGTVRTVVGQAGYQFGVPTKNDLRTSQTARDQASTDADFTTAITAYPIVIRLDSKENLIVGEDFTGTIRRIDFVSQRITKITDLGRLGQKIGTWIWLDVDRRGNIGPVDDILVAQTENSGPPGFPASNQQVWRIAPDGSRINHVAAGGVFSGPYDGRVQNAQEGASHYPWAVAIDDSEARFITMGVGTQGVASFRPAVATDPTGYDNAMYNRGLSIHTNGNVGKFPYHSRPPFWFLYGKRGQSMLPGIPNFDDIIAMSDAELTDFIQAGMNGQLPRPELTGRDLRDYMYFLRRTSLQGNQQEIDLASIEAAVTGRGEDLSDTRAPEIRNVQTVQLDANTVRITWQTDEPTLGLVRYGPTHYYGLWSAYEEAYTKDHTMDVTRLLTNQRYHVQVQSKDRAGNFTVSPDITFDVGMPVPTPNPTPSPTPRNTPPMISTSQDRYQVEVGQPLNFTVTATDSDSAVVTLVAPNVADVFLGASFQ